MTNSRQIWQREDSPSLLPSLYEMCIRDRGKGQNAVGKFDSDLKYSTTWSAWNTYVNDARVTYDAVSYTHLDVYKRQVKVFYTVN